MKILIALLLLTVASSFALIDVYFGENRGVTVISDSTLTVNGDTLKIALGIEFGAEMYFWDVDGDRVFQMDSAGTVGVLGDITVVDGVYAGGYNFATAAMLTGGADSLVIDFDPDIPALTPGLTVEFVAEAANGGVCSLSVDGGAWKQIFEATDISALEAGDIANTMFVTLKYDGTQWQQTSQSGN